MERIAIVSNISWTLYNFRLGLAQEIKNAGYEPILISFPDKYAKILSANGWKFIPLKHFERTGINPIKDLLVLFELIKLYKSLKITCAFHYYSKSLVYGNLAASLLKIPFIPTIAGLGGPFSDSRPIVRALIRLLYKISFANSKRVVFQNDEDLNFFVRANIIKNKKAVLIEGSGIDLMKFNPSKYAEPRQDMLVFLMYARLTKLKGVEFYVEAAKAIKKKYKNTEFRLAGTFESDRQAVKKEDVLKWHNEGIINYLGVITDIPNELSQSHTVVLPSFYWEGLPRTLIEAAAMAKPIITTDNVGCRQVVTHGVNGFLVAKKSTGALISSLEHFISLSVADRLKLGETSRQIALERFDEKIINKRYISLIKEVTK